MNDAVLLDPNIAKPRAGTIGSEANSGVVKSDPYPKAATQVLRGISNGEFSSQVGVKAALGIALNLGRSATDAEAVSVMDEYALMLQQLGPGAEAKFIENYNRLSQI